MYPGIVQMLLKTYASDDILSEAHASVCDYKKPDSITPITYAERLSDKAERTGDVFPEDTLKEVFLTGLPHNYRGYVRGHLSSKPTLSLAELARFAVTSATCRKQRRRLRQQLLATRAPQRPPKTTPRSLGNADNRAPRVHTKAAQDRPQKGQLRRYPS